MIKVWDGFIRGFHWLLVIGIAVLYVSGDEGWLDLHFVTGYLLLALMVTRIIWGVIGSDTAKLSALCHHPRAILSALKSKAPHVGHNPAGSLMVLFFFVVIFVQLVSGLLTSDDILMDGPLVQYVSYDWVELAGNIHQTNIDILLLGIAIHIIAIALYRFKGVKLLRTLLTGKMAASEHSPKLKNGMWGYIIFAVLAVALIVFWGLESLGAIL
ncbi:cytochrome b/b6 domain-containing protein [Pseudoalteromonas obscura]|uniref:Cytochrome b/b6 domain-containing protein n=1 Tax=Pseudoalteromonas obscura TaxID=3048491 RepID=A0ABT7ERJ1_9GAMM|nr:cytochrome b/b6 domain-containing protein [Pseudoalteromonas sp. P94(2023)]MDK2597632.1 cytochrome b/b6 domain-containing protein [Pseudoalteromonas sp. P94(2023)]